MLVPELPGRRATSLTRVALGAARLAGQRARRAARRQAGARRDRRRATPPRPSPSTSCAAPATSPPARAALAGDPGRARARLRAAAHRVHRRLARAGHQRRRLARRVRGRAGAQVGVPPLRDPRRRGGRRRRLDRRGRAPAVPPLPRGDRPSGRDSDGGARPITDRDLGGGNVGSAAIEGSGDAPDLDTRRRHRPGIDPTTGRPRKFAYPPNLLVVDGGAAAGRGGVGRARRARRHRRRRVRPRQAPRGGLAARRARPGDPPAHQRRRSTCCSACATRRTASRSPTTASGARRGMTVSELDAVPGLGEPARRAALLKHFGSVAQAAGAPASRTIAEVPGVRAVARPRPCWPR